MAVNKRKVPTTVKRQKLDRSIQNILGPVAYVVGVLVCGFVVAACVITFWKWLSTTDRLALQDIIVEGNRRATVEEIITLSGIQLNENLLQIDLELAARRISVHPWISYVEITPRPPDTLHIDVEERCPAAFIELGGVYVISDEARVFKRLLPYDELNFPVITGIKRSAFKADPAAARVKLTRALGVIPEYKKLGLHKYDPISEIHFSPAGEMNLVTEIGGTVIIMSQKQEISSQFKRLKEIYSYLKARNRTAEKIVLDLGRRTDRAALKLSNRAPRSSRSRDKKISTIFNKGER